MQNNEFEGKTTEEAIENASRELNIPVEDLDIDIIEPGSAGIFGLVGGKKAKIQINLPNIEEPAKEEPVSVSEYSSESPQDQAEGKIESRRTTRPVEEAGDRTEEIKLGKEALENILKLIPIEATVTSGIEDGKIMLNIEGDKSGLLIGRKGKTLDALQFIVNKIVNKALEKRCNIVVDSENYRKRRKESLVQIANKMGDKAKRIKKPVTTNLLNPHDRRIVHLALKEDEKLDTRSRGEGLLKKVVIIPKR